MAYIFRLIYIEKCKSSRFRSDRTSCLLIEHIQQMEELVWNTRRNIVNELKQTTTITHKKRVHNSECNTENKLVFPVPRYTYTGLFLLLLFFVVLSVVFYLSSRQHDNLGNRMYLNISRYCTNTKTSARSRFTFRI